LKLTPGQKSELWLAAALVLGIAAGAAIGRRPLVAVSLGMALYLAWHVTHLVRVLRWMASPDRPAPSGVRGIWRDLVEAVQRVQRRNQKRKAKMGRFLARFRDVTSSLPDAAVILGKQGEVEWCNPAAGSLLGLHWPRAAGRPVAELLPHPAFLEYLARGDFARPLELPAPTNNSRILALHVTRYGKKRQRLVVARDVTRVYHLDQVRRDFVANVSHELRTPLTVLSGFLETLHDTRGECPQWARSVELMQQQTMRMGVIVNDLLMLSRMELDDRATSREAVAVPEMLASIVEDARVLSAGREHPIALEADPDLWLQGSGEELRSAFSNLVFNAVQHTPAGTEVALRWFRDERFAYLEVADQGEGIPAHHLPRLTERFYRIDKARSRAKGGTGLGLAIAKHAVHRHGGELLIASEVGEGSTFTCRFPPTAIIPPRRGPAAVNGERQTANP
jgi:two-component system phosphate regulon sensor histidine kinase PhoR